VSPLSDTTAGARAAGPVVSVLIPAYDAIATLDEAVRSVFAQTFADWEVVIADDGSTDGSLELGWSWMARESRVRLVRHPAGAHLGRPATRNLAVREARGEIVAFLDADDELLAESLASYVAAFEHFPRCGVIYGQALAWRAGKPAEAMGRGVPGAEVRLLRQLARFNVLVTSATAVRRRVLTEESFPLEMTLSQDWACWVRLAQQWRYVFLPVVLSHYRIHPDSGTERMRAAGGETGWERAQVLFLHRVLRSAAGDDARDLRAGLRYRATSFLRRGISLARHGRWREASLWLALAREAAPSLSALVLAALAVAPEQIRIWRGIDPSLAIAETP